MKSGIVSCRSEALREAVEGWNRRMKQNFNCDSTFPFDLNQAEFCLVLNQWGNYNHYKVFATKLCLAYKSVIFIL